jgi:hypothetical protein
MRKKTEVEKPSGSENLRAPLGAAAGWSLLEVITPATPGPSSRRTASVTNARPTPLPRSPGAPTNYPIRHTDGRTLNRMPPRRPVASCRRTHNAVPGRMF